MTDDYQTGLINKKPMQRDMFTGELSDRPPKRGNGSHIALRPIGIEKPAVAGMASYAGDGPEGKYCRDCDSFGEIAVARPDGAETVEMNRAGCVIWAKRMGHAGPQTRSDISTCAACVEFVEPTDKGRCHIITKAGEAGRMQKFPPKIRDWRPEGDGAPANPATVRQSK